MVLSLYFIEIIDDSNQTSINPRTKISILFSKIKKYRLGDEKHKKSKVNYIYGAGKKNYKNY